MIDTNVISHLMRYPEGIVGQRIRQYAVSETGVSIIVVSELRYGAARVNSERLTRQIDWALSKVTPLTVDEDVAEHYANIRAQLERRGTPIGANDTFIAAHALALDLTLVTDNVREFSRVPDLRVENWLD